MNIPLLSMRRQFPWLLMLALAGFALFSNTDRPTVQAMNGFHFSILAESIQPIDSSIKFNNYSAYLTTIQDSTENPDTDYIAQVNLPDGAVISGIHVYGIDNDSIKNFGAGLYRYNQDKNPVYEPVTTFAYTAGSPGKTAIHLAPSPAALGTIDNLTYSYGIYISLPRASVILGSPPSTNLAILRIVVDWGQQVHLPTISR